MALMAILWLSSAEYDDGLSWEIGRRRKKEGSMRCIISRFTEWSKK